MLPPLEGRKDVYTSQIPPPEVGNCSVPEPHAIAHVVSLVAALIVVDLDALAVGGRDSGRVGKVSTDAIPGVKSLHVVTTGCHTTVSHTC